MNVFIGSDHAGFELKQQLVKFLSQKSPLLPSMEITDRGTFDLSSVDYPDFANLVCLDLKDQASAFGILICGSGQGMCMRANKYNFIRAALVYNSEIAKLSREHNDANLICLGSRFCTEIQAQEWIKIFLTTSFAGGRHATRVAKLAQCIS
jgi:ribose 5-phosphate isomerase B